MESLFTPLQNLSVLVTCFNKLDSLDGFLLQARELCELGCQLIVVDDGSQDGSAQVLHDNLQSLPNCQFVDQPNQGSASARNAAITHATGEFLQFLDIDDFLNIKLLVDIFTSNCLNPTTLSVFEIARVSEPLFPPHHKSLTPQELDKASSQTMLVTNLGYSRIIYPRKLILNEGLKFVPTFASLGGERFILDDFFWLLHLSAINVKCVKFDNDAVLYGYMKPENLVIESGKDFENQASLFIQATSVFIQELSHCTHLHDLDFISESLKSSILFHLRFVPIEKMLGVLKFQFSSEVRISAYRNFLRELGFRIKILGATGIIFFKRIARPFVINYALTRRVWAFLSKLTR
jgi:glycosyltransferase involved in cell wall biosynthesis